ncbi:DUF3095 family protein [Marinospirillum sp. MEB164]|uniref:DUF3095 family protein n=1 Tax=Marinospirillum alkalitolerans TaxID=3123374 RepID=A0ABW8PZ49_9GAMM
MAQDESFFSRLPFITDFQHVFQHEAYHPLPEDWWLVITDIRNSTQAVAAGRYREVNSLAGCTVAALLNALRPLEIPYVFGGDGASFCIPPSHVEVVRDVLAGCQHLAEHYFGLSMRASLLPYREISSSASLAVCRYQQAQHLQQTFFSGQGLLVAEALIKESDQWAVPQGADLSTADFSGFECRWQAIPSPKEWMVSCIVAARTPDTKQRLDLYQQLIHKMDVLAHTLPFDASGLELTLDPSQLRSETLVRTASGANATWSAFKLRLETLLGKVMMLLKLHLGGVHWGEYKQETRANTDFRKLDGYYRCIFAADENELAPLKAWLEEQKMAGRLFYGLHLSHAAQLTCLISESRQRHVHFIDGCQGGYALAAQALKAQEAAMVLQR